MRTSLWSRLRADHGLLFMWILVWLFTLSSVVVNGAHALDITAGDSSSWMRGMAVVVASFFPFAGLVMTEAVLIMIRSWRVSHWWVTSMQALLVVASLVMLVVAFWRSFNALTEMAVMLSIPASDAWMLPVLTDTGIVVGTIGVVLAEVKMKIDGDAAAHAEVAEAEHRAAEAEQQAAAQVAQYDAEVQALAPAEAVAHPAIERSDTELSTGVELFNLSSGLDDVADEHAPAQPVEQGAQNEVAQPEQSSEATEHPAQSGDVQPSDLGLNGIEQEDREWLSTLLSGLDEGAQCADEGVEQVDWIETEQPGLSAQLSGVEQPEQPAQVEIERSAEQPEHADEQPVEHSVAPPEQSAQIEARSLAERAHPELNPKVSVEVLAELIAAHRDGASQRRLGEMAGVSPNTAARYVQAAERLGSHPEAA